MKIILIIFITSLLLVSCNDKPKDFTLLTVNIKGDAPESIGLNVNGQWKYLKKDQSNHYQDTLRIDNNSGFFTVNYDGDTFDRIYAKNGEHISIEVNSSDYKSAIITGTSKEYNFFIETVPSLTKLDSMLRKDEVTREVFAEKMDVFVNNFEQELKTKGFDSIYNTAITWDVLEHVKITKRSYMYDLFLKGKLLQKGSVAPTFTNFKSYQGGTKSSSDFLGRYVLIDVWATWCGPCLKEIPHFKEIAKMYKDKNIAFVGISIDRQEDYEKWKKMIAKEQIPGEQLFSGSDATKFQADFIMMGIPRYFLIDPKGNIIDANAPAPSAPELKKLLDSINI